MTLEGMTWVDWVAVLATLGGFLLSLWAALEARSANRKLAAVRSRARHDNVRPGLADALQRLREALQSSALDDVTGELAEVHGRAEAAKLGAEPQLAKLLSDLVRETSVPQVP